MQFHLNKGTFFEGVLDENVDYNKLINLFVPFMASKYANDIVISGGNQDITIRLKKPVETDEDINKMINILNSMIQLYMIAANVKL